MKFEDGFPALTRIFKRYILAAVGLRWCNGVAITGECRITVNVSVDPNTKIDGERGRFAAGATKAGDAIDADIMRSKITLASLCCRILSSWPGFRPAFTNFTNICSSVGVAAWNS